MEKKFDTQDLIDKRLLESRKIFLWGNVDEYSAKHVIERLLFLELEDNSKEIKLLINSGGGEVYSGMAIHDIMTGLKSPISTICCGSAMSMASIILSAGKKGRRFILPYGKVMIHQPNWGVNGQATDIEIRTKELLRIKKYGAEILSKNCNQPFEKVMRDEDRDYYMDSEEATNYGIVDEIINNVL
jgi:ATP-dependent Clp protease protease subunit